jgi:hypothetical protein
VKFRVIFTLDYEIHGNGHGSPRDLMVEPTGRMMAQFGRHGAKLTVMADVAEILRFKRHLDEAGRDVFDYRGIEEQLKAAIRTGHDVQLHLHPSYYRSRFVDGHLEQNFDDYDLARLPAERLDHIVGEGKRWLEELLRPVAPDYRCNAFRAANWSMNPAGGIVKALVDNGIAIDTSVFKYGTRDGMVSFDYGAAYSDLVPWPVQSDDVCRRDPQGRLFEFPIYCERQPVWRFLTATRVYRALLGRLNPLPGAEGPGPHPAAGAGDGGGAGRALGSLARLGRLFLGRHAWKLDFNQCSGRQLIAAARRVQERYGRAAGDLPLVLIGHSKLFTRINERSLEPFLRFVAENHETFAFGTFQDFDLQQFARGSV